MSHGGNDDASNPIDMDSTNGHGHSIVLDKKEEIAEEDNLENGFMEEVDKGGEIEITNNGMETKKSSKYDKYREVLEVGDVVGCCMNRKLGWVELLWGWLLVNKSQILSGITVALAQVPEAVSFSFVAGVDPIVGLQSAWIMGICTSLAGGRPGMVAGATGAVAIVLPNVVDRGIGYMFYAIMLAGLIQMAFGILRLGKIVRLIPHPVMVGFCNGLGIVIGVAQFNIFKIRPTTTNNTDSRRLVETFGAFAPFTNGWEWVDATMGGWMTFHIAITILTYIFFPKLTKAIPSSLAAIIVSTVLEWALIRNIGFETNTVKDLSSVKGSFPLPVWVDTKYGYKDVMPPLNGETLGIVIAPAITAAAIGLLESLLTLQIIDEMTKTKGNENREAFGQGLGQFLSGVLGGMGGCTTIGQSMMNLHSGGYTRLSSSCAAIFMLIILLAAYPLINLIPVASLAGIMFLVTYFTVEWESAWVILASLLPRHVREQHGLVTKVQRSEVLVMLIVVAVTLILDLAIAVGVGVVLSSLIFAWDAGTKLTLESQLSEDGNIMYYTVQGPLYFGSVKPFMDLFPTSLDLDNHPKEVRVLLENTEIYDWSGMMAIKKLHERMDGFGCHVSFEKLTPSSHKLLSKSQRMIEEINIFQMVNVGDDIEHDPLIEHSNLQSDAHF